MGGRDYEPNPFAGVLYVIGWMLFAIAVAVAVVIYANGCAPVTPPVLEPDAGACEIDQGPPDGCGLAARHVVCELGCAGFGSAGIDRQWGTADDDSFADACRAIGFDTTCLASAETCAQAEVCGMKLSDLLKHDGTQHEIPFYVLIAREEMGVCEVPGEANSTRVLEYLRTVLKTRLPRFLRDETPWCSAFVNWCVTRAGRVGTGKSNARSWLTWGAEVPLDKPLYGCVAVLKRGTLPWQGHVGFLVGWDRDTVTLLGGNQQNRVSERRYHRSNVLGFRTHLVS